MAERSLSDLVQQAEQLTSHMDSVGGELPRVERSLTQILHSAQTLWTPAATGTSGSQDAQASILLGSRGLDLLQMGERLDALSARGALEALTPCHDADVTTFLTNERHNAIISAVEDAKKQTQAEVGRLFWEQQKADWEQSKQKFMSAFSGISASHLNVAPVVPQDTSISSISMLGGSMSSEEASYLRVIVQYNTEVLHGGIKPSLAQELSQAANSLHDDSIDELWNLVSSLSDIPVCVGGDVAKARNSQKVQRALVTQAIKHLEKSYEKHMRSLVYSHLESAQLGGVPGLVPLVKAYLKVALPQGITPHLEDDLAQGVPVWPLIFYCLRAGGAAAAAEAVRSNSNPSVSEVMSALLQYDKTSSVGLPADTLKRIRLSYRRNSKSITDPYKRAVHCVMGCCDVNEDHTDIITTTDDYLWLKLSLVDREEESVGGAGATPTTPVGVGVGGSVGIAGAKDKQDRLTLTQLQNTLYVQYGESHFNAWQQPLLYTSVLLLSIQFEAAIEFLSRIDRLRCHALHIALALYECNLLALTQSCNAPLLSVDKEQSEGVRRLNMSHLIKLYTRKFELDNLNEALQYCFFLRHLAGNSDRSVFSDCICDLVLQSREFDLLLGALKPDGSRTPGIVDKFKVDVCEIAEVVAADFEKKGLHEDAIKLFDLAKNHEKVLSLLNQLLGQVVPHRVPPGGGGETKRERVLTLGSSIALRFRTHGSTAPQSEQATLHLLLDLATFFDLYHQDRFANAIEVLKRLRIVSLTRAEVESRVRAVGGFGGEVRTALPQVLLAAMTATYQLYKQPLEKIQKNESNISILDASTQVSPVAKHLKEQATAIVTFAGMIPLRLHADVNARLVQLEAMIN